VWQKLFDGVGLYFGGRVSMQIQDDPSTPELRVKDQQLYFFSIVHDHVLAAIVSRLVHPKGLTVWVKIDILLRGSLIVDLGGLTIP
jgi:hypothetical protein